MMNKFLGASLSLAAICFLSPTSAMAAAPTLVTACPTTLAVSGFYEVQSTLNASGDCITITAKNVTLGVEAYISGTGSGTGIRIAKGATGAVIRGDYGHYMDDFIIGVEDDAGDAVIGDFSIYDSVQTGMLLNGASTIATMVDDIGVYSSGHDGIHITSPTGARLDYFTAQNSGTYGVWLDAGSKNSVLADFGGEGNGVADIEIAGSTNLLVDCQESGGQYGIVIEKGAKDNLVSGCSTYGGAAPSIAEAVDNNKDCGSDLWPGNRFKKSKPDCTRHPAGGVAVAACEIIQQSGYYYLTGDLVSTGGDCLVIGATKVTLYLANRAVTGAGSGIGLHVLPAATGFRGIGGINGKAFAKFAIGAEIDANGAVFEEAGADHNADTGILVNHATAVTVGLNGVSNNRRYGYHLLDASQTMVHNYGAFKNSRYGVFIEDATGSLLDEFQSGDQGANGIAGVYIGCSNNGPNPKCASSPSLRNVISHGSMHGNTQYGLAVDTGSDQNVLANVPAGSNGTDDFYDGNANCANNLWFFDTFTTSNNASCMNEP